MQIWAPYAEVRVTGEFPVRLNAVGKAPFAVISLSEDGLTALTLGSAADCDRLDRAIARARSLLLCETSEPPAVDDEPASFIPAVNAPPGAPMPWEDGAQPGTDAV